MSKKNKTVRNCIFVAIGMFAFTFALVPIYNVMCNVTGINGKVDLSKPGSLASAPTGIDHSRIITVEFDVTFNHERPPKVNIIKNEIAKSIGASKLKDPLNIVATQLNILIPVGTAISIVANIKYTSATTGIPTVNIWCAQTTNDNNAIPIVA